MLDRPANYGRLSARPGNRKSVGTRPSSAATERAASGLANVAAGTSPARKRLTGIYALAGPVSAGSDTDYSDDSQFDEIRKHIKSLPLPVHDPPTYLKYEKPLVPPAHLEIVRALDAATEDSYTKRLENEKLRADLDKQRKRTRELDAALKKAVAAHESAIKEVEAARDAALSRVQVAEALHEADSESLQHLRSDNAALRADRDALRSEIHELRAEIERLRPIIDTERQSAKTAGTLADDAANASDASVGGPESGPAQAPPTDETAVAKPTPENGPPAARDSPESKLVDMFQELNKRMDEMMHKISLRDTAVDVGGSPASAAEPNAVAAPPTTPHARGGPGSPASAAGVAAATPAMSSTPQPAQVDPMVMSLLTTLVNSLRTSNEPAPRGRGAERGRSPSRSPSRSRSPMRRWREEGHERVPSLSQTVSSASNDTVGTITAEDESMLHGMDLTAGVNDILDQLGPADRERVVGLVRAKSQGSGQAGLAAHVDRMFGLAEKGAH